MEIPQITWTLELAGSGLASPRSFTFAEMARMPMVNLNEVKQLRSHGPDGVESWRGPALAHLTAEAGIKPGPMTVIVEASDGYQKECTRDDLEYAVVALQTGEGVWLADKTPKRPIKLIPPKKAGDYWIRNVSRITFEPKP